MTATVKARSCNPKGHFSGTSLQIIPTVISRSIVCSADEWLTIHILHKRTRQASDLGMFRHVERSKLRSVSVVKVRKDAGLGKRASITSLDRHEDRPYMGCVGFDL